MKAAELLRLYEAGRRDFSGESLRGQNFKGKDLSGADFSGTDIRSANFTNANLTGANFTQTQAGLQRRWSVCLLSASLFLFVILGLLSSLVGQYFALVFRLNASVERLVMGWSVLAVVLVFIFLLLRKSIGTVAFSVAVSMAMSFFTLIAGYIVLGIAKAIPVATAGVLNEEAMSTAAAAIPTRFFSLGSLVVISTFVIALAEAAAMAGAVATAIAISVVGVATAAGGLVISVAIILVIALALKIVFGGISTNAIFIALVVTGVSGYVGWHALRRKKRDSWIRSFAIVFASIGGTSFRSAILTDVDFSYARFKSSDLRWTNQIRTSWHNAIQLDQARLRGTILINSAVRELVITHRGVGKSYAGCNLQGANLIAADLSNADLTDANISHATLASTWLVRANLTRTKALGTSFYNATLTGACLEAWNIDSTTSLEGVICEFIYLLNNQRERRPSSEGSVFESGEFTSLFEEALNTIDLIFQDGVDWQVFFQSFQELRSQYSSDGLSIQAIEKKSDGAFIIRLEVSSEADKPSIESSAKEIYEAKLALMEDRYRAELQAKDGEIVAYREQSANLMRITEMLAARPLMPETPKYDMRGAQFAGGFAETVQGDQIQTSEINTNQTFNGPVGNAAGNNYGTMSAIQNNYGSNTEDITRLLTTLRDQAQTFPIDQKDEALDTLEALQDDIAKPEPDQGRIGRRLKKLVALGAAIGTLASGAAAVSGDVSTFTGNVIELTEQLGIPIEQVQLPASGTP